MPLLKRKAHPLVQPPEDLRPQEEVFIVRFTGEIFREYEDYLDQITLYRQRLWTCKYTGKSNLTFEEALASEEKSTEKVQSFPDYYKGLVLRAVHHSTARLEELTSAIAAKVRDDYLPGEEILAVNNSSEIQRCRVIRQVASVMRNGLDNGHAAHNEEDEEMREDFNRTLELRYEVEWLVEVGLDSRTSIIPKSLIKRKKHPLSRALLRSWISSVASQGSAKGSPWIVADEYVRQYCLPRELPQFILEAQQQAKLKERAKADAKGREKGKSGHGGQYVGDEHENGWNSSVVRKKKAKDMPEAPLLSKRIVTPTPKAAALETFKPFAAKTVLPTPGTKKQRSILGGKTGDGDISARAETESECEDGYEDGTHLGMKKQSALQAGMKPKKKKLVAKDEHGSSNWHKKGSQNDQVGGLKVKTKGLGKMVLGGIHLKEKAGLKVKGKKLGMTKLDGKLKQKRSQIQEGPGQKRKLGAADTLEAKKLRLIQESVPSGSSDEDEDNKIINKERCSECRRGLHPEGSELLMCDTCPRSYHLACLAMGPDDLPEGEWKCPKCIEKEVARQKRMEELEQRIREKEGRERAKLEEREEKERKRVKEKEEREAKERQKQEEKEEKERKRLEEKEEKERKRQEEKEAKEQQRKEEREKRRHEQLMEKRKRLYPMEDLQVLVEEAKDAARAAKWAGASGTEIAVPTVRAPRPLPQPLDQVLGSGGGRVIPSMFGEIMQLWDFCQAFGKIIKSPQPSLQEFVGTLGTPGASDMLIEMYMAIFKALLESGGGQSPGGMIGHGVTAEVLERWQRHLDISTWQEIIRRYLARGNHHMPELLRGAVKEFGQKDWADVSCTTHLEVMRCIWDDYLETDSVREFLESNIEAAVQLQKDKYNEEMEEKRLQNEEKKREKEEKKAAKAAKKAAQEARKAARKAWKEALERGEPMEGEEPPEDSDVSDDEGDDKQKVEEEPDFELPEDVRQYAGDPNDRRAILAHREMVRREEARLAKAKIAWLKKKEVEKKAEQKAQEDEQKRREKALRAEEEARRKKEEAFEKDMSKLALRSQALGWDRHHNRYWWFSGDKSLLFVEEGLGFPKLCAGPGEDSGAIAEFKSRWFCYTSKEELDCLMAYLNPKGIRELALKTSLQKYYWQLSQHMKRKRRGGVQLEGVISPGMEAASAPAFTEVTAAGEPVAMKDMKKLPVSCNLVHGDYIVDEEVIFCNCQLCVDKPDEERKMKLGEFAPHVECRTRNAQASIRVELPGQKGLTLVKWLEDQEEARKAEAAAKAKAEAASKEAPAQAAQGTLASLEATAVNLQEKLESRGLRSRPDWANWKRQLRAAGNSVAALKPLLLQVEDSAYELGEPFPEPEVEIKEGETDVEIGKGTSDVQEVEPAEIVQTLSEYEEHQVEEGEDDSADSAGQLWRTQEMRNIWRSELNHAGTLSWLTYLLYTLSDRCEPLFEIQHTARSTGKRSARVPARHPAKRAKSEADSEEDEEHDQDLHEPVWEEHNTEEEADTNMKPSRRQRSAIAATATPSTVNKSVTEVKLVKAECARCQKQIRQAAASSLQPCSACRLGFHLSCVGLKTPPADNWLCPNCATVAASAHSKGKGARSARGSQRRTLDKDTKGELSDAPPETTPSVQRERGERKLTRRIGDEVTVADQAVAAPSATKRVGRQLRRRDECVSEAVADGEEVDVGEEAGQKERTNQRRTRGSAVAMVRDHVKRTQGNSDAGIDAGADDISGKSMAVPRKTRASEEAEAVTWGDPEAIRRPVKKRPGNLMVDAPAETAADSHEVDEAVLKNPAIGDKKARSAKRKGRGPSVNETDGSDVGTYPPPSSKKSRGNVKSNVVEIPKGESLKKGKKTLKVVTAAEDTGKEISSTPRVVLASARSREFCGDCGKSAKTGGEVVRCCSQGCGSVWHTDCLRMRSLPKGPWFCTSCRVSKKK